MAGPWGAIHATQPVGLRCELLRWPESVRLSDHQPEFSWELPPRDGMMQVAWQIQVARAGRQFGADALIWDSGRVEGPQALSVSYAGPVLDPSGRYEWRVRVWTRGSARPTSYSAPQAFWLEPAPAPYRTPTQRTIETMIEPTAQLTVGGRRLWDFGKSYFGYLVVDGVRGAGDEFVLRYGEKRGPEGVLLEAGENIRSGVARFSGGDLKPEGRWRVPMAEFRRPADAVSVATAHGTIVPLRFVDVEPGKMGRGLEPRLMAVHYPFEEDAASFSSSDPLLDEVWRLCRHTIKATSFAGIYVDGDRERLPYEADAYINQLGHYATDREYALARHTHEYLLQHPTWPTEWRFHSVFMAWEDYWQTGDAESLRHHYPALRSRVEPGWLEAGTVLWLSDPAGTSAEGTRDIVDWPEGERDGYVFTECNTVVNAFYYRALVLMAKIAAAIDRPGEAAWWKDKAEAVRRVFRSTFFDEERGAFRDGRSTSHASLHASMFPLAFGLVEPGDHARVLAHVKQKGMVCSVYGAQYLLEALFMFGETDVALRLITAEDSDRSWTHMLRSGASMTWEAWDAKYKPNLDWNHAWGAAPANLLPRFVLGVGAIEPGFGKIRIQPQMGGLTNVAGKVPTIRGPVEVSVRRRSRGISVDLVVPGNVTAELRLPIPQGVDPVVRVDCRVIRTEHRGSEVVVKDMTAGRRRIEVTWR